MTSTDPITGAPLPDAAIQRILYLAPKVHIYRIPPLTSAKGFNAASWTANPSDLLFTARLRILETAVPLPTGQEKVSTTVLLEDPRTGDLFAACPYTAPASVQQALDSSRFFALRVVGEGNMKATLGVGFEERSDAFDFSVALQDARRVLGFESPALAGPGRGPGGGGGGAAAAAAGGAKGVLKEGGPETRDFRLREGETITVDFGGRGRRAGMGTPAAETQGSSTKKGDQAALFSIKPPPSGGRASTAVPFLPPPPSAGEVRAGMRGTRVPPPEKVPMQDLGFDDGEFGEFQ